MFDCVLVFALYAPRVFKSPEEVHAAFSGKELLDEVHRLSEQEGSNSRNKVNEAILKRFLIGWTTENQRLKPFFDLLTSFPGEGTPEFERYLAFDSDAVRRVQKDYFALIPRGPGARGGPDPRELEELNNELRLVTAEYAKRALLSNKPETPKHVKAITLLKFRLADLVLHFEQIVQPYPGFTRTYSH